jgi:hypothetical protein
VEFSKEINTKKRTNIMAFRRIESTRSSMFINDRILKEIITAAYRPVAKQ